MLIRRFNPCFSGCASATGRSPKDTSPKLAWLTPKGLRAVKKIKTNLEIELKD